MPHQLGYGTVKPPHSLAAGSRFGRYRPEEEKQVRKVQVSVDPVLEQLKTLWKEHKMDHTKCNQTDEGNRYYLAIVGLLGEKRIRYTPQDVEGFSLAMAEFQGERTFSHAIGYFLSALINSGPSRRYTIHTSHLEKAPSFIGYENVRSIVIEGQGGFGVGSGMIRGSIHVKGNAGNQAGQDMTGGKLIVEGHVEDFVGLGMMGGKIHVKGNALGCGVGRAMDGGTIVVDGDASPSGFAIDKERGTIIVKGKMGDKQGIVMTEKGYPDGDW